MERGATVHANLCGLTTQHYAVTTGGVNGRRRQRGGDQPVLPSLKPELVELGGNRAQDLARCGVCVE